MRSRAATLERWLLVAVTATTFAGAPMGAAAASAGGATCGKRQTLVRVDTIQCKANRFRPAITISRACCENAKGRVRCKPFKKCPKRSPSA